MARDMLNRELAVDDFVVFTNRIYQIKELESIIIEAKFAYYVDTNPVMSDDDYDLLEDESRDIKEIIDGNPTKEYRCKS